MLLPLLAAATALAAPDEGTIEPTLQLQTWVTAWDQDEDPQADPAGYGDPEDDMGVGIHRARVGVNGTYGAFDYNVSVGTTAPYDGQSGASPIIDLVSAYGRYTRTFGPGSLRLALGTRPVPFSRERMLSSSNLMFQERGVAAQWMAPTWGNGATAEYTLDMGLRVTLGAFNGDSGLYSDRNDGETFAGRVEWQKGDSYDVRNAESGTIGVAASTLWDKGLATDTMGFEGDAFARFGPIQILAEGSRVTLTPGNTNVAAPVVTEPTVRLGAQAMLSWIQEMDQGRTEIAARFSYFDDNNALSDNGDVAIVHAGVTRWDLVPGLDVGAGFIHRMELGGRAYGNDTARLWMQLRYPRPAKGGVAEMPVAP